MASAAGLAPRYVLPLSEADFLRTTSGKIMRDAFKWAFLAGRYDCACTAPAGLIWRQTTRLQLYSTFVLLTPSYGTFWFNMAPDY